MLDDESLMLLTNPTYASITDVPGKALTSNKQKMSLKSDANQPIKQTHRAASTLKFHSL